MRQRTVIILAAIAGVVIIALIAALIFALTRPQQAPSDPPTTSPTTPAPTDAGLSAEDQAFYDDIVVDAARFAGEGAARWRLDGTLNGIDLVSIYEDHGLCRELATIYEPVWISIFTPAEDYAEARTETRTAFTGALELLSLEGELGARVAVVAVSVDHQVVWQTAIEDGGEWGGRSWADATWTVTYDEAAGCVSAVEQPSVDELGIELEEE